MISFVISISSKLIRSGAFYVYPPPKNIGTLNSYPRPFRFRQCFYLDFMQLSSKIFNLSVSASDVYRALSFIATQNTPYQIIRKKKGLHELLFSPQTFWTSEMCGLINDLYMSTYKDAQRKVIRKNFMLSPHFVLKYTIY